jgi:rubrerythrin
MPLEFLLSVHIATEMPDLSYDMATTFDTNIQVLLHPQDVESKTGYKEDFHPTDVEREDPTYITYDEMAKIKGEGKFDFQIVDPLSFLENMVIGLRTHYSKQELIEQIRNYIVNSIIKGITEVSNAYKINIQEICEKSKETDIGVSQNVYDDKLLEKGIKITFFNIEKLEANEESRYIATTEIKDEKMHICKNCGNVLEEDDTFCKICGALNISE